MSASSVVRATFPGSSGDELAARLELPDGSVRAFALFAHCFSCTKDILASRRIASGLATAGVAVLRFDFTGLGSSEGDFANTDFSSNVEDLIRAADYLRRNYEAPIILIGHSLGGAAVLVAAERIPESKAVVTISAPADVAHVLRQLGGSLDRIRSEGEAEVKLAGRPFRIRRSFVEDAEMQRLEEKIRTLGRALLVLHAPRDEVVGIGNASRIFLAARHPKSFISLDDADHLLSRPKDASYAAGGIATGPNPYDYLSIALGACTAMTLRVYAEHKKLALGRVSVEVRHGKVATDHCVDCSEIAEGRGGKLDRFERIIRIEGQIDAGLAAKIVEIADKCPVHRTLESSPVVVTRVAA